MKRHHIETIVQVLTESAGLDRLIKVPVAGNDDASLADPGLVAANWLELTRFDDAHDTRLLFQSQRIDLVQEERALAGGLELADLAAVGPGEGPLNVAEELAFHQVRRQRRTRHGQETMQPPG